LYNQINLSAKRWYMNKHITHYFFLILLVSICFSSCDTLRKSPKNTTARKNQPHHSSARNRTANTAATRSPVRKPVPKTSTTSKPAPPVHNGALYSRPATNTETPKVVEIARTYAGTPYRSGGNDKNGIDCSGLICSVYSELGVKVPRISWQQSEFGSEVGSLNEIKVGDWVFFVPEAGKEGYVSHAGIVTDVRNNEEIIFIHASTSRGVREDNLFSTYFKGRFVKAMRPFKL
jgi:probable lipoprotein NlpC